MRTLISFRRQGLRDAEADTAAVIGGLECARWIASRLREFGADWQDEAPIAEDWGYAIRVRLGQDMLLIGCAIAPNDDPDAWCVMIGDNFNGGLFPWTRRRRDGAKARLSEFVLRTLRVDSAVSDVEVERSA